MTSGQRIVVAVMPDGKGYTWWVIDRLQADGDGWEKPPRRSEANITTSSTTLKNAIGSEMPTLGT